MAASESYAKASPLSRVCQALKPQKAFVECQMELWNLSHILCFSISPLNLKVLNLREASEFIKPAMAATD